MDDLCFDERAEFLGNVVFQNDGMFYSSSKGQGCPLSFGLVIENGKVCESCRTEINKAFVDSMRHCCS